ncbi:reverse transcriptase zinc-binding domain-containing protein [Tanacetum coccineum]
MRWDCQRGLIEYQRSQCTLLEGRESTSNGRCTLMWYDNWSGMGPHINYITYRNLYNAGMDRNYSVSDMIDNGSWKWPRDWYDLFPFQSNITVPNLIQVQERLLTQDRLKRWGCYDMMVCSLCLKNEESHNHLFYQCDYIKEIWNQLTLMMEGSMIGTEWKKIVDSFAAMDSKRKKDWKTVFSMIYDSVRTKMMGLEVKRSDVVCLAAAKWNVKMNFKDSDKGPSRESTLYLGVT